MSAALPIRMVDKPWGKEALPPPFETPAGRRIGEIWFEPPADLATLLVKYIFTSEALSVQVHPSDAQAEAAGLGRQGKEECWLVTAADPGARIGIGFTRDIGPDEMRQAAHDGSIEGLLGWFEVAPGDFFYIPANTVHAIGAGVSLIEIQQNSDVTYRLYDYGRPRELHLDAGMAVARGEVYPAGLHRQVAARGSVRLVDGPFFRLDRLDGGDLPAWPGDYAQAPALVIPLAAGVAIAGEAVAPGQCARVGDRRDLALASEALALLVQPIALPA